MSVRKLFKNKYLFRLFLTLFSFELYFNHEIKYHSKNKGWIIIRKNCLAWDHKYAELQHVIDHIDLVNDHSPQEMIDIHNMFPRQYAFKKNINDLIENNYTKYEVFTSNIINHFLYTSINDRVEKVIAIHIKHIRANDDVCDIASFSYLYEIINNDDRKKDYVSHNMYRIQHTAEISELNDILTILSNINLAKVVLFTDWRILYRNNLNLSYSRYSVMPDKMKNMFIRGNCSFYGIIRNKNYMFATELLS